MKNYLKEILKIRKDFPKKENKLIEKAYKFAERKHKGQKFDGSSYPYFIHPAYAGVLLARWGRNYEEICAGLLHDVVEDCNVKLPTIKKIFGPRVAFLVDGMSWEIKWNKETKSWFKDRVGFYKKIMDYSFSFLKDKKVEEIEEITGVFFKEVLYKFIFPEIIDIINEHKAKDREVIIVSNGADILVKKIADYLNIKNYISTRLEITNGKFTGKILGDIVYGKNKVKVTNEFIKKNNLDLYNSYAYTDHISDLDLLLMVFNPCAVNPDNLLFEEAKKRNWPVLMFNKNLINK